MTSERDKLIYTIREQLKSDMALGGKWLPKGQDKAIADIPQASPGAVSVPEPAQAVDAVDTPSPIESVEEPAFMTEKVKEIMAKKQQLKEIAAQIANCQECTLAQSRINTVPGEGNPKAKLVFVGEAPGQSEDEQGRPFVGRAGKLLDKIIDAMGLSRDDVFICNILKCRPPGNRDPQASEVAACSHFLYEQLNTLDPTVIVALGTHAAHTLLETKTPIGQLRGKMHNYHPAGLNKPIKLAATYHPAYLLRNYTPETRGKVWDDMKKVLKELDLPIPKK